MNVRLPKLRELKEAVTAVLSPRFTTRFPAEPCVVPERYRGKPEFDLNTCVGCGACVNVCPTSALTQVDDLDNGTPVRRITLRYDTCIFCANCRDNCTTETGIKLSNQWDLAGLDRQSMRETHEYELQLCEKCGTSLGTKKHLVWLCEKLGPLAYTNPSLLLAKGNELLKGPAARSAAARREGESQGDPKRDTSRLGTQPAHAEVQTSDFMRILCPKCRYELNVQL
jgi:formate hydrogenlyase subunit 6/NADH:ubiquinone oxidoreductase subunit I